MAWSYSRQWKLVLVNVEVTAVRYAVQRFLRQEGGATAVEYAIIAGAIFLFIVTGVQLFGEQVGELFNSVTSGIATVSNG